MEERRFRRVGLGYAMSIEGTGVVMEMLPGSNDILTVRSTASEALPLFRDIVYRGQVNMDAGTAAGNVAKALKARHRLDDQAQPKWESWLTEFFIRVREEGGPPILRLADVPLLDVGKMVMKPFLPEGMASLMYGEGMSSKSTLGLGFAVTVSSGTPVIPGIPSCVRAPVIIIDTETTAEEARFRVEMICKGAGIPVPRDIHYFRIEQPLWRYVDQLSRVIDTEGIGFLLADSLAQASGGRGEHQSAEDNSLRYFQSLLVFGLTSLTIHHPNKMGQQYGSVYNLNQARAAWEVRKGREDDAGQHITLFHQKWNTSSKHAPLGMAIKWDEAAGTIHFRQEALSEDEPDTGISMLDRIIGALRDAGHPLAVNELAARLEASTGGIRMIISRDQKHDRPRLAKVGLSWGLVKNGLFPLDEPG